MFLNGKRFFYQILKNKLHLSTCMIGFKIKEITFVNTPKALQECK